MELWEKTVESKTLFEGKIITVRLDQAELPNGQVAGREVVEHPGGVAILPLFDDGTVSVVRQFRYPPITGRGAANVGLQAELYGDFDCRIFHLKEVNA